METAKIQITPRFVLAGRAIFTVSNGKGQHYTFRVARGKPEPGRAPIWFASVLTGGNNDADASYTYVGILSPDTGLVKLTKKSKYSPNGLVFRVINWATKIIWQNAAERMPDGYEIAHAGRCGRCGRELTHPDGVTTDGYRLGFGPDCWQIMQAADAAEKAIGGAV